MFEIIPSPGTEDKNFDDISKKLTSVIPPAHVIHVDIIDGKFAPNTTFLDAEPFAKFTMDAIFEVHLMVDEPVNYLESFAKAGFTRFIGQIEKMSDQVEFVAKAQEVGEVALALDLESHPGEIKVPFRDLDSILIMSVKAGFSGQKFNHEALEKVKKIREQIEIPIEVDGGINDQTIVKAAEAGAERFVATSFIFGSDDPKMQFQNLQEKLTEVLKS